MKIVVLRFMPVDLSRDDIRRIYAGWCHFYDLWSGLTQSRAIDRSLQMAQVRDGESILEVAVGTGRLFERLVTANPRGRNEGIDLSPDMLLRARRRLSRRTNYRLQVADAHSIPFQDDSFDVIINNYMFDLLPEEDFAGVLAEFQRVLKADGRMVVTTMTPGRTRGGRVWEKLVRMAPRLLAGCRPVSLEEDIKRDGSKNMLSEYVSQLAFPSLVIYCEKA